MAVCHTEGAVNETDTLLRAIKILRPDLPGLVGSEAWVGFKASLDGYLDQIQQGGARASVLRARVLALFSRHPQAQRRLLELVAEFEADLPDESGEDGARSIRHGGAVVTDPGSAPADAQAQPKITRYTDIVCPRQVWVGSSRVSVVVRLTVQQPAHSAAAEKMVLREDLPVQVRVEAPFFEPLNAPRQEVALVRDRDSAPLVFDLRPLEAGHADITVDFFQNGDPVGTARVAVEVTESEVAESLEPRPASPIHFEPSLAPSEMVLHVAWNQRDSSLHFTLIQDGGASWNDGFRPVLVNGNPGAHAAAFFRQVTSLVGAEDATVNALLQRQLQIPCADVDRRVKSLGQNLWRELVPEELKALYGRERERWRDRHAAGLLG